MVGTSKDFDLVFVLICEFIVQHAGNGFNRVFLLSFIILKM